jgi:ligand-binding SRPBCC domain-containing protein
MKYRRAFRVRAPLEAVRAFHDRASSLEAITPPPLRVRLHAAPPELREGARLDFSLALGPLAVRWLAGIEAVSARGFTDRLLAGPFRGWTHRHRFTPLDASATLVEDEIEIQLKLHPVWGPAGMLMYLSLPALFAYRSWRTRRLLEPGHRQSPEAGR